MMIKPHLVLGPRVDELHRLPIERHTAVDQGHLRGRRGGHVHRGEGGLGGWGVLKDGGHIDGVDPTNGSHGGGLHGLHQHGLDRG
jgi:hypothetical protein